MTAVLLALATALTYGLANYAGPLLGRRLPLGSVLLGSQLAGLAAGVVLVLVVRGPSPGAGPLLYGAAAGAVNALALVGFYRAGRIGRLSVVAPIGSAGAVVPVAYGLIIGERPSAWQLLGVPLALAGVVLVARRPEVPAAVGAAPPAQGVPAQPTSARRTDARTAALYASLAAVCFGGFLILFAQASAGGTDYAVLSSRVALVSATGIALLLTRQRVQLSRADWGRVAVPGLLLVVGTAAYGAATTKGLVSVVSVIATMNPIITVGLALILLGERLGRGQQLGVVLALAGAVLIAAG